MGISHKSIFRHNRFSCSGVRTGGRSAAPKSYVSFSFSLLDCSTTSVATMSVFSTLKLPESLSAFDILKCHGARTCCERRCTRVRRGASTMGSLYRERAPLSSLRQAERRESGAPVLSTALSQYVLRFTLRRMEDPRLVQFGTGGSHASSHNPVQRLNSHASGYHCSG